jgi:two-component system LytT family sensor kinase
VENALRHGVAAKIGPGHVTVRATRDNGWTSISVEDSGAGLSPEWTLETSPGTGLRNLKSRLIAEFGDRHVLDVRPRPEGGVLATVRIPFERFHHGTADLDEPPPREAE